MDNPIAANTLGTLGAVCWSVQLIPQIIVNYRRHDTTGLQPSMMLLWACAGVPLGVYNIVSGFNTALLIQPQLLTFLSLVTWAQCKYYRGSDRPLPKWSLWKILTFVVPIASLMGGIEVGLVYGLRAARERHIQWPTTFMAVLSAVLLCAGVLRHYWDIYQERTVRGISFMFIGIDALGDLTSLISVLFQARLNISGLVIYGSELILWLGVFACGGYYNLTPWVRQKFKDRRSIISSPRGRSEEQVQGNSAVTRRSSSASSTVFRTASGRQDHTSRDHDNLRLRNVVQV